MGHICFLGIFVFFIVILFAGVFFNYIHAMKNAKGNDAEPLVVTGESKERFFVKKCIPVIAGVLIFAVPFLIGWILVEIEKSPENSDVLWAGIDFLILGFFVFVFLLIKSFRSYIHVREDGFEYRQMCSAKFYSKAEMEFVCQNEGFIFVKRKGFKVPVIIESMYADSNRLYGMLCGLVNEDL